MKQRTNNNAIHADSDETAQSNLSRSVQSRKSRMRLFGMTLCNIS